MDNKQQLYDKYKIPLNIQQMKSYINIENLYKAKKNTLIKHNFFNKQLNTILKQILTNNNKPILLTIADSLIPPNGGGEEWLLSINKIFNKDALCIAVCFKDILNKTDFTKLEYEIYNNIHIIKAPFNILNILEIICTVKPHTIMHQGFNRLLYMKMANIHNINFVTGFCFWNDFIIQIHTNNKRCKNKGYMDLMNINMENKKYKIHKNFDIIEKHSNYYFASNFMNKISLNVNGNLHPVIETINTNINIKDIYNKERKYVTLLNVNPLKGGYVLLYLLEHLPFDIPIIGVITEHTNTNFENKLRESFKKRNLLNNVNILFNEKQKNIHTLMDSTKVMLIPSIVDETFCRVAYESITYGLHIVSYNNGNLKYLLANYENNIFIDNPLICKRKCNNICDIDDAHYEKWLNAVSVLYNKPVNNQKSYLIEKYNLDFIQSKNKLFSLIRNKKEFIKDTIGFYGPFCDQGLGIQIREYYVALEKMGYKCAIFSHKPYIAIQKNKDEWDYNNIYMSKNLRENTTHTELLEFVWKYKIKYMIIPEIVCKHIFDTIYFLKMLGVIIITPINIEILQYIDTSMFYLIDNIIANNKSSYNILKYIFPYKNITLLEFNNTYLHKTLTPPKNLINEGKIVFSTYGGLNSIHRKNIINTFDVFNLFNNNIFNKDYIDFQLNIYIQGNTVFDTVNIENKLFNTDKINIIIDNKSYSEIIQSIQKSDIIIHLGDHEGLGLGFYEALNNNKPVITLDTYPNNEIIKNMVNGFLIGCDFTNMTDNKYGVINRGVVNNNTYIKLLKSILYNKNVDIIQRLINNNLLINNNYYKTFKNLFV